MDGNWLEVRGDAKMPGTILLRDKDGYVYFISYPGAQQVSCWWQQCMLHCHGLAAGRFACCKLAAAHAMWCTALR